MSETTDTRAAERCCTKWKYITKQAVKTVVCLVLCVALVWGYSYKQPMEVHATAVVAVVGAVAVALCVTALGVKISGDVSTATASGWEQSIWDNAPNEAKKYCSAVEGAVYVTPALLEYVGSVIKDIYVDNVHFLSLKKEMPNGTLDYINPALDYQFYSSLFGITNYKTVLGLGSVTSKTVTGLYLMGTFYPSSYDEDYSMRWGKEVSTSGTYSGGCYIMHFEIDGKSYGATIEDNSVWIGYNPSIQLKKAILAEYKVGTETGYVVLTPSYNLDYMWVPLSTSGATTNSTTYPVDYSYLYAQGSKSVLNKANTASAAATAAATAAAAKNGTKTVTDSDGNAVTTVGLTNTGSDTAVDSNTRTQTQEQTTGAVETAEDTAANEATNATQDTSLPKPDELPDLSLPKLITKKFPFCIPFDIYAIVSGFYCSSAKAPHWEIPVVNKRFGWNWHIDIDFTQFEPVAVVCRWFNGAAWVFALILVTRKLIGAGGGD